MNGRSEADRKLLRLLSELQQQQQQQQKNVSTPQQQERLSRLYNMLIVNGTICIVSMMLILILILCANCTLHSPFLQEED